MDVSHYEFARVFLRPGIRPPHFFFQVSTQTMWQFQIPAWTAIVIDPLRCVQTFFRFTRCAINGVVSLADLWLNNNPSWACLEYIQPPIRLPSNLTALSISFGERILTCFQRSRT